MRERATAVPVKRRRRRACRSADAAHLEARFGQPLLKVCNRGRIFRIHVSGRRDELDDLEPVCPDLQQLIATEVLLTVQVRRHPELPFCHKPKHLSYN